MRIIVFIILLFSSSIYAQTKQANKAIKYVLIKATKTIPGDINQSVINSLNEPLKAIAAYYSALGGSNCQQDSNSVETCELTSALKLGTQGSGKHKALLKKWFCNDSKATKLVEQNCYLAPSGAIFFSDYIYLYLIKEGNLVTAYYSMMLYERGKIKYLKGPDKILIQAHTLKFLKRSRWQ